MRKSPLRAVLLVCAIPTLAMAGVASCGDDDSAVTIPDGGDERATPVTDASDSGASDALGNDVITDADAAPVFLEAGALCADAGAACGPGFACCVPCCVAGPPARCMPIPDAGGDASCALPNLSVDVDAMVKTAVVTTVMAGTCEVEEQCADDGGLRKVLRFEVTIPNNGAADLVLGDPDGSAAFEYGACHMHYHFTDFARYSLLNDAGTIVSKARKQAFCARDDIRNDPTSVDAGQFDCQKQGISRGWSDKYSALLPCQWLDISDLPPGTYTLEVEVNPARKMTELDYTDNIARIPVTILP